MLREQEKELRETEEKRTRLQRSVGSHFTARLAQQQGQGEFPVVSPKLSPRTAKAGNSQQAETAAFDAMVTLYGFFSVEHAQMLRKPAV